MKIGCPIATETAGSPRYHARLTDLPPSQAGVAVALRRAFEAPADETVRKFEELLSRLG